MLKSVLLTAMLFSFCANVNAEISPDLAAALQAYRDQGHDASRAEELSLAIFQESLKSLPQEEYTPAIMKGYTEAYGDVHPLTPKSWRNGELALTLMEKIMSGDKNQKWLGWQLLEDIQGPISDFAGQHTTDREVIERIFKLAAEFPAQLPEGRRLKNWSASRRNLIARTINRPGEVEDALHSLATVKNVEELLPTLPDDYLQGDALRALGQSRREGALPYLLSVVQNDTNLKRKLGALLGLGHLAEHVEVLELAREIALRKKSEDIDAKNLVATAAGMVTNHYTQARRMKTDVSPRAVEIATELWNQPDRPDLKRWLLFYLGPIDEEFVEEKFVEALKQPDLNLQSLAMEYSSGGKRIVESPKIEEAIIEISKNAPHTKQKEIAEKYLERRRQLRKAAGGCEDIVTKSSR